MGWQRWRWFHHTQLIGILTKLTLQHICTRYSRPQTGCLVCVIHLHHWWNFSLLRHVRSHFKVLLQLCRQVCVCQNTRQCRASVQHEWPSLWMVKFATCSSLWCLEIVGPAGCGDGRGTRMVHGSSTLKSGVRNRTMWPCTRLPMMKISATIQWA